MASIVVKFVHVLDQFRLGYEEVGSLLQISHTKLINVVHNKERLNKEESKKIQQWIEDIEKRQLLK